MYDSNVDTTQEVFRLINILIADKSARAKRVDNPKYMRILFIEIDVLNDVLSLYPIYFHNIRYVEKKQSTMNLMISDADNQRILDMYVMNDTPNWQRMFKDIERSFLDSAGTIKNNGYNE